MTLSGRDFGVAVVACSLAALLGCKQILDLHDRSEAIANDGGAADGATISRPVLGLCGPLRHASASCADCMDAKCCDEANACHGDPACDPAFDCNMMCGDDGTCRARCSSFFTRSETFVDVSACRESQCQAECGLSCGGFGYAAPGCDTCVKQTCCGSARDCAKNGECVRLDLCRTNCVAGSSSCPTECAGTFSGGVDALTPWLDCVQNMCAESCQSGRNWQCLDTKTPWLKPKSAGNIALSITIVDVLTEKPFVGTTARACRKLDRDCTNPIDTQTTNEEGEVSFTVPAGSIGFDGYVDFTGGNTGGDNGEMSAIYPAIWYPSPNVVSSGWRGRIQFVSRLSLMALETLTSATTDPTRGHFAVNAQDCNFASAGGVSFSADTADDKTTPFYFVATVPKTNTTQTDPLSGIGGFINLPANQLTYVTATVQVGDTVKTIGQLTYIIRPGTFTTTSLPPVP